MIAFSVKDLPLPAAREEDALAREDAAQHGRLARVEAYIAMRGGASPAGTTNRHRPKLAPAASTSRPTAAPSSRRAAPTRGQVS